jgi:phosphoribosylformylglycinamidine synthase
VGLLETIDRLIPTAPAAGDELVLIGATSGHLGQSTYLADLFDREEGDAPPVDLGRERAAGEFVRAAHARGLITAAHDLSDGGLALAAAEMALAGDTGVTIDADPDLTEAEWFFGEDQARYLVACRPDGVADLLDIGARADVPVRRIGTVGGEILRLGRSEAPLRDLRSAYDTGLTKMLD